MNHETRGMQVDYFRHIYNIGKSIDEEHNPHKREAMRVILAEAVQKAEQLQRMEG